MPCIKFPYEIYVNIVLGPGHFFAQHCKYYFLHRHFDINLSMRAPDPLKPYLMWRLCDMRFSMAISVQSYEFACTKLKNLCSRTLQPVLLQS